MIQVAKVAAQGVQQQFAAKKHDNVLPSNVVFA